MLHELVTRAKATLRDLFSQQTPLGIAFSSGKDSSCCANLVLETAAEVGATSPIIVLHADTRVENPEITAYAQGELAAIRRFAEQHGLNVRIETAQPPLSATWVTRVIGGRGLPIFPDSTSRDCTMEWKIRPIERVRKRIMREFKESTAAPVIVTGVRFAESAGRAARMESRGESDRVRFDPKLKEHRLSLICYWDDSDVWEYLGLARAGAISSYSSFDETFRIYADSAGTSCAVVGDDLMKDAGSARGCGARTGCWACAAVGRDRSLENMIDLDPKYAYLKGLNQLQRFLLATQYDWSRRNWVGRTIKDGYIKIQPDTYSPAMLEELMRYALTLDVEEAITAQQEGREPRFRIVSVDQLLAVDAMWSLYGHHRPFHALTLFREVYIEGKRYPIPSLERVEKTPLPEARYLFVGDDWNQGEEWAYAGLRSPELELLGEGDCIGTRMCGEKVVMDVNAGPMLSVDQESAYLVLELELDALIARYHNDPDVLVTAGFRYYATMGTVALAKGQLAVTDSILRRTAFKSRNGLVGPVNVGRLLQRSISEEERVKRLRFSLRHAVAA